MKTSSSLVNLSLEGKPLEKLIDVVSKGIATLYEPRRIRKMADANAYAIKVIEKASAEADVEKRLLDFETQERIVNRIAAQEIRRQDNIDSVVEMAAEDLSGKEVADEPVSEDWATRFFGIVQDISQEEMKELWSRILAKEIEKPTTISMRTLDVLRNLSPKEAELFERVSQFVLCQRDLFILNDDESLGRYGVKYEDLALLVEVGVLQPGDFVIKTFFSSPDKETVSAFFYGKYVVFMTLPKNSTKVEIPALILSKAGRDIYGILKPEVNMDYLGSFANYVKKRNSTVIIRYAEFQSASGNNVSFIPPLIDL